MKKKNVLDLATSVDVLNTLSGGISEPQISYYEHEQSREIRLRVPGIDKERRPCRALEKCAQIEAFIAGRKTKTIYNFRSGWKANRHYIISGYLPIAIHIMVFYIAAGIRAKGLIGRIAYFFIIIKQPFGYQSICLSDRVSGPV